jgi:glycosyltransferase involved in cell wall biosynthesis
MANILIAAPKVPFTSGGQETLVKTLMFELRLRGHTVDTIELPFKLNHKESLLEQAAMWRSLDVSSFGGTKVDLVIATKFPSYFINHPRKSVWLVHQHRPIYDLYGGNFTDFTDDPRDESIRRMLTESDTKAIKECAFVSGISKNVIDRLRHYNGIDGQVLYPPLPLGNRYRNAAHQNYILSVGRLCGIKRVDLMLKGLPIVHNFMKLKVAGAPDESGIMDWFKGEIEKHHLWDRVEFLGRVDDEALLKLYAEATCVYYAPYNEDYGYVTLEAMASGKPVITASDSGGVLEFVKDRENGLIVEPTTDAIGHAVNTLVEHQELSNSLGLRGRKFIEESGLLEDGWDKVINGLLSPLTD